MTYSIMLAKTKNSEMYEQKMKVRKRGVSGGL
jgi:hypothetical protein